MNDKCDYFNGEICTKHYQPDFCDDLCEDYKKKNSLSFCEGYDKAMEDFKKFKDDIQDVYDTVKTGVGCMEKGFIDESLLHTNMAMVYLNRIIERLK
jgi:hypothetical protein